MHPSNFFRSESDTGTIKLQSCKKKSGNFEGSIRPKVNILFLNVSGEMHQINTKKNKKFSESGFKSKILNRNKENITGIKNDLVTIERKKHCLRFSAEMQR